jgi:hypothetical protein
MLISLPLFYTEIYAWCVTTCTFYLFFRKLKKCDFKEHKLQEERGGNTYAARLI